MSDRVPAIEHLLRTEAPQVLGALVRRFGQFDIAEDAVQEALLAASRTWPTAGVPENPRSWLIRIGYRKMSRPGADVNRKPAWPSWPGTNQPATRARHRPSTTASRC